MAKFPPWGVGTDVNAANLANDVPNIVVKASTNSIVSNVTLANDGELVNIALEIGTWEIDLEVLASSLAGAGLANVKTAWAFTGTLTGTPNRTCIGPAGSSVAAPTALTVIQMQAGAWNASNTYGLGSTAVNAVIKETCRNFVVATAGNFSIQFAQGTSAVTATIIAVGTNVKCRRIA